MGLRPSLILCVLHSLNQLLWFPLQLMHQVGESGGWSSAMWSFNPHDLQHGVVQLLDACENIPHLLHWYTWVLFSYGVTVQLKLNNLTDLRSSRVFLSFLEVRSMIIDTSCFNWMSFSQ